MGQISFKIILVVPLFVLLSLSLFVFYGYDIDIVDGKLNVDSPVKMPENVIVPWSNNLFIGAKRVSAKNLTESQFSGEIDELYFYNNELKDLPITLPWQKPRFYSSYHLYPILIKTEKNFKSQKQVFNDLRKNKIGVNLHYIPIHRHPYYEDLNFKYGDFPVAEKFHQEALSIPIFPNLQEEELDYVVSVLRKVLIK